MNKAKLIKHITKAQIFYKQCIKSLNIFCLVRGGKTGSMDCFAEVKKKASEPKREIFISVNDNLLLYLHNTV